MNGCSCYLSYTDQVQSRTSMDTLTSSDDRSPVFTQAISVAFEPYLSVWIEAQDRYALPSVELLGCN